MKCIITNVNNKIVKSNMALRIDFDWTMIPYTIQGDILHVVDGDTLFHP